MKEKIIDILEKHYHGRNHIENRCADELLDLFSVSNQREQLISFFNWYKDDPKEMSNNETIVDAYLDEINCC
jgi:hypothetical protein